MAGDRIGGFAWAGRAATATGIVFFVATLVAFFFTFRPDDQWFMALGFLPMLHLAATGVAFVAAGRLLALLEAGSRAR